MLRSGRAQGQLYPQVQSDTEAAGVAGVVKGFTVFLLFSFAFSLFERLIVARRKSFEPWHLVGSIVSGVKTPG